MNILITKTRVATLLQVAIGVVDTEYNKYINEAQEFDLKPLVCEDFYYDLLSKKTEIDWKKIIDGGTYTYNGRTYEFLGLEGVLAYFSHARFFLNHPNISTSHGIVKKQTPFSEPVNLEERKNTYYMERSQANAIMSDVVKYIERNIEKYPSWKCSNACGSNQKSSGKTSVIK